MSSQFFEDNKEQVSKKDAPDSKKIVADYLKQMQNFEADRIKVVKENNNFLKKIAGGSIFVAALSVGAVIGLTPLKTVEPYLVRVDNLTGAADIIRPLENITGTTDEKLDKYWIYQAINERESYNWTTVQSSYDSFSLFSNDTVFSQYKTYILGEDSPVNKFEGTRSIKVEFRGATFIENEGNVLAQVRLSKTILNKDGKPDHMFDKTYWQASVTYDYSKEITRSFEEAINPLGFQLTSYRIDPISE